MSDLVVQNIYWKKGETGLQKFYLYDSDGVTQRNGTGLTYSFKFWNPKTNVLKGSGSLSAISASIGQWSYLIVSADTDTVAHYLGEIIEDPSGYKLRSNTFDVYVEPSSNL